MICLFAYVFTHSDMCGYTLYIHLRLLWRGGRVEAAIPVTNVTGNNLDVGKQLHADFNLSGGRFGTDIIQKCPKWSQIGVHGLIFGQIFAKFQRASF